MCGGVDPRPMLRTWLGVLVCIVLVSLLWGMWR